VVYFITLFYNSGFELLLVTQNLVASIF